WCNRDPTAPWSGRRPEVLPADAFLSLRFLELCRRSGARDDFAASPYANLRLAGGAHLRFRTGRKVRGPRHLSQCSLVAGLHGAGAAGQYDVAMLLCLWGAAAPTGVKKAAAGAISSVTAETHAPAKAGPAPSLRRPLILSA